MRSNERQDAGLGGPWTGLDERGSLSQHETVCLNQPGLLQNKPDWGLRPQTLLFHSSGGWKSTIKGPADLAPGKDQLPSLWASSCCALRQPFLSRWAWEDSTLLPLLFLLRSCHEGPVLVTSSKPDHLPKAPLPNTITLESRVSTYTFRNDSDIQPIPLSRSCLFLCLFTMVKYA